MKRQHAKTMGLGALCALYAWGCGDDSGPGSNVPWEDGKTRVVTTNGRVLALDTPSDGNCLALDGDECVNPSDECGDAAGDVVLDERGRVLHVVCYPKGETLTVEQIASQAGVVKQNQNNVAIILDHEADGPDLSEGLVLVDANNVVIYGESPETALVTGDVSVQGNNIVVRGVRIEGNVDIEANNATFLNCVIRGDVRIHGNNAVFTASDVIGSVEVRGHNARVLGNDITDGLTDDGKNTVCADDFSTKDADGDGVLDESERGTPLSCDAGKADGRKH